MDENFTSDKVVAVKVYFGYSEAGKRSTRCDVKYEDGDIVRNVAWDTFPLDEDVVIHDIRAVNRFE